MILIMLLLYCKNNLFIPVSKSTLRFFEAAITASNSFGQSEELIDVSEFPLTFSSFLQD